MKISLSVAPAALLVLAIGGCKQPTYPSFSPDGNTLVFEKGGKLLLRSPTGVKVLAPDVEGQPVWSEDGKKLVYTTQGGTTIFNLDKGSSVRTPGVGCPYAWEGNLVCGIGSKPGSKAFSAVTIDGDSGASLLSAELPFYPTAMTPLPSQELLISDGKKAYRFDGLGAIPLPALDGMEVLAKPTTSSWLLEKSYVMPHSHVQKIDLYDWDTHSAPRLKETLDPFGRLGSPGVLVAVGEVRASRDGRMLAAVAYSVEFAAADQARLLKLVDRFDLFNDSKNPRLSKSDGEFLLKVKPRRELAWCLTRTTAGSWTVVRRAVAKTGTFLHDLHVAISPDGSKLAICDDNGVEVRPLGKLMPQ